MADSDISTDRGSNIGPLYKHKKPNKEQKELLVYLASLPAYHHWAFSQKVAEYFSTSEVPDWRSAAGLPYLVDLEYGRAALACALNGQPRTRTESAHVVAERNGVSDFNLLRKAGVVPPFARHYLPSNRIELSVDYHRSLDHHDFDFLTDPQVVLVRLAAETIYFENQLRARKTMADAAQGSDNAVEPAKKARPSFSRPPFGTFYARLEDEPAIVRMIKTRHAQNGHHIYTPLPPSLETPYSAYSTFRTTNGDKHSEALRKLPPLPPYILPVSSNLLIFAMANRTCQFPPSTTEVIEESGILGGLINLLMTFWFLEDDDNFDLPGLLQKTAHYVGDNFPSSPYATIIADASSYTIDSLPTPIRPSASIESGGTFVKEQRTIETGLFETEEVAVEEGPLNFETMEASSRISPGSPQERADIEGVGRIEKDIEVEKWVKENSNPGSFKLQSH